MLLYGGKSCIEISGILKNKRTDQLLLFIDKGELVDMKYPGITIDIIILFLPQWSLRNELIKKSSKYEEKK